MRGPARKRQSVETTVSPIDGRSSSDRGADQGGRRWPAIIGKAVGLVAAQREALSRSAEVLKPINYMLRRWSDFARVVDDGRICLSNNAAERALRGIAVGRRNWTFAG